jgi:hypothetical protein
MRIIVTRRVEGKPDQELFFVAMDEAGHDDWNYCGHTGASPEQIRLAMQTLWQVAEQWLSDQVTGQVGLCHYCHLPRVTFTASARMTVLKKRATTPCARVTRLISVPRTCTSDTCAVIPTTKE